MGDSHQLGRSTNNGQGQFKISDIQIFGVSLTDYKAWLASDNLNKPETTAITIDADSYSVKQDALKIAIQLIPLSPIFTMDPASKTKQKGEIMYMKALTKQCDGITPILLASTIRGVMKAQAAKIYCTLTQRQGTEIIQESNKWLQPIFGGEKEAAKFSLTDFEGINPQPFNQNFIAIDRFTGGVKDGANYNITRFDIESYQGSLEVQLNILEKRDSVLAVFLMVLRDMLDGEIRYGGYQAKGFGKAKAVFTINDNYEIDSWDTFTKLWQILPIQKALVWNS